MTTQCMKRIWEGAVSRPCERPAKFYVRSKATGNTFERCGVHVRQYKDRDWYEVRAINGDAPR